jgi:hypothetical protein
MFCKDYKIDSEHTDLIRRHYKLLLEKMDVEHCGLIEELFAIKVIDFQEKNDLESIAQFIAQGV